MAPDKKWWVDQFFYASRPKGKAFTAYWKKRDGSIIKIYNGESIVWDNGRLTQINIKNDTLVYEYQGQTFTANLGEDRSELIWSDGDVWKKHGVLSPPERRPLLFVMFICLFAFAITQFAIATWLDEYFDGGNSGAYAIWWGFYNGVPQLMSFFLNSVWGDWSDIIGRKPVFILANVILLGYPGAMLITPSLVGIVVSSICSGCGNVWLLMSMTMFTDFSKYTEEIAKNFGKALILMAIGSIIGVFAQSIFIQRVDPSWRVIFLISVIIFGVVVFLLTIFAPETNHAVWQTYYGISYHKNEEIGEMYEEFEENEPGIERKTKIDRNPERNPFKLVWSLRNEHPRLRGYVIIRAINAYIFYSFQASFLAITEELYGWNTHDVLPVLIQSIFTMMISNALIRTFQRRMSTENLVILGCFMNILETGIRCFAHIHPAVIYISRLFMFGPAACLPACITALISEIADPDEIGRILGAVDAISNFGQFLSWTIPVLIFALFVSGDPVPYIPVAPWILECIFNCIVFIFAYYLMNYIEKPALTILSREDDMKSDARGNHQNEITLMKIDRNEGQAQVNGTNNNSHLAIHE